MVFITLKTNKTLTLNQQRQLKEVLSDLAYEYSLDNYIMIQFEVSQVIYLNRKMKDCVKIDCYYDEEHHNTSLHKDKIVTTVHNITEIEKEAIFVSVRRI